MSTCMYKLRPIVSHGDHLPAPSHSMYHMRPVHGSEGQSKTATVRLADLTGRVQELIQESKGDMASLEGRQEDILKKLAKLRMDIEELRVILKQPTQESGASTFSNTSTACPPCPEVELQQIDFFIIDDPNSLQSRLNLGELRDIVIYASPEHPPFSLLGLAHLWSGSCSLELKNHTHSSVKEAPATAPIFNNCVTGVPHLRVTLVWKEVGPETELIINPVKHIAVRGESNILRFLSRMGPGNFAYENDPKLENVALLDEVLDNCQQLARTPSVKEKQAIIRTFNTSLGKSDWLCGQPKLSLVDVAVWSILKQLGTSVALTQTLSKWMERCESMLM